MGNNQALGQRIRNSFNPSYNTVMNAYEDQMLAEQVAGEPNVLDELGNRYDPQLSGDDVGSILAAYNYAEQAASEIDYSSDLNGLINPQLSLNDIESIVKDNERSFFQKTKDGIKGFGHYVYNNPGDFSMRAGSMALDFFPVAGQVKAVREMWTGTDWITGEETSRLFAAMSLIPGGKIAAKTFGWLGKTKPVVALGKTLSANKYAAGLYKAGTSASKYITNNKRLLISESILGGFNGGYGAISSGGDSFDVGAGVVLGSLTGIAGNHIKQLKNPYVLSVTGNFIGQGVSKIHDSNNKFNYVSLAMAPVATAISRNLTSHATVLTQGYGGYKLTRSEMMINKAGINVFKTITSGIAEVFPNAWASYYGKKLRS